MKNIAKTTVLLAILTAVFMGVGYAIGGQNGMWVALAFATVANFAMYWWSGDMVLRMQGAILLDTTSHASIAQMVAELAQKDNLPMPRLFYIDTPIPNAFATGRNQSHAVVAVTRGITELLSDSELKAVIGHELGHVKHGDMLISTVAASLGGAISGLAQMAFFFGGNEENRNPFASLVVLLLAPFVAMLIQLAISRGREFDADEHGAELLGNGEALASALLKLESVRPALGDYQPTPNDKAINHLMFANMFSLQGLGALFSTHPPAEARIARLKEWGNTAKGSGAKKTH